MKMPESRSSRSQRHARRSVARRLSGHAWRARPFRLTTQLPSLFRIVARGTLERCPSVRRRSEHRGMHGGRLIVLGHGGVFFIRSNATGKPKCSFHNAANARFNGDHRRVDDDVKCAAEGPYPHDMK